MSLPDAFKTTLCQAFTGAVTHMSLHTANPGTTGANDSAVPHAALSAWSAPADGVSTATGSYTALTGDYTHIGLWAGATFRQGRPCEIHYTAATNVNVLVTHAVGDE